MHWTYYRLNIYVCMYINIVLCTKKEVACGEKSAFIFSKCESVRQNNSFIGNIHWFIVEIVVVKGKKWQSGDGIKIHIHFAVSFRCCMPSLRRKIWNKVIIFFFPTIFFAHKNGNKKSEEIKIIHWIFFQSVSLTC